MSAIAVVKPDHLGDLVLSVPAIRALIARFGSIALFASPSNRFVADHFFPSVAFRPTAMRHLQKTGGGLSADGLLEQLKSFSAIVFLREDATMQEVAARLGAPAFIERGSFDRHETLTQRDTVTRVAGTYSRSAMFPEVPTRWPTALRTVGLCISAGFHANKWPVTCWADLGRRLARDCGYRIRLIGGPVERHELAYLRRALALDEDRVVEGSSDVAAFLDRVQDCDAVIGTDSGTLHLVATRVPVLGLFTSSPWRRFAPFGRAHRLLTAEVACSPCLQFYATHYNACLTRECAMLIEPRSVVEALHAPLSPGRIAMLAGLKLIPDPASTGSGELPRRSPASDAPDAPDAPDGPIERAAPLVAERLPRA